jgi:two-component system, OmpR family, sensor kinase
VTRLDRGLFTLDRRSVDLVPLVQAAADAFRFPGMEVDVQSPPELVALVDAERVRQLLENLMANAVQHSPQGTPVVVELRTEDGPDGRRALITVTDWGPGIPPEIMPRVFHRFVSGANSRGLGIGLHLARGIAAAHGGDLAVDSAPGQTRFTLSLPMEPADPELGPGEASRAG